MFKVGDIIRVKENADKIYLNYLAFAPEMKKHLGKEFVIWHVVTVGDGHVRYRLEDSEITNGSWVFDEAWLESVECTNIGIEEDDIGELLCMK